MKIEDIFNIWRTTIFIRYPTNSNKPNEPNEPQVLGGMKSVVPPS